MFFFSPGITSDMLRSTNYSAIIGPQCSQVCSLVGRLASYHNIACFSGVCQDTEMLNKNVFTVSESHFNSTFSFLIKKYSLYNIHVYKFCSVTAVTVFLSSKTITFSRHSYLLNQCYNWRKQMVKKTEGYQNIEFCWHVDASSVSDCFDLRSEIGIKIV